MVFHLTYNNYINRLPELSHRKILLYGDFNVINILYENGQMIGNDITLYPDSTAVFALLNWYLGKRLCKTVSTDFQEALLSLSIKNKKKIFFWGDTEQILEILIDRLKKKYHEIDIAGICSGYDFDSEKVIDKVNTSNADILFVGIGSGQQEKWIIENHKKLNPKLIISVGGWFKILSGTKKRAPHILRKISLEWLYKLVTEFPHVWKRYLIGIPKFFYRVISKKIIFVLK